MLYQIIKAKGALRLPSGCMRIYKNALMITDFPPWSVLQPDFPLHVRRLSESARSLKSLLLATDTCRPVSELEIEQSNGAALPAPQAGRQLREGCQRPVELPNGEDWKLCIQNEESKIRQYADRDSTLRPSSVSIFRVPSFLKVSTKSEAYVPKIVSLGPYHHGHAKLKSMEIHKVRAMSRMVMRINDYNPNELNNMYFFRSAVVKMLEDKDEIMNNYEEKYDSNPEDLVMMVRDGCFILEILRTLGQPLSTPTASVSHFYEPIFEMDKIDYTGFDIVNDMLKLENQIPLVVLIKLLKLESKFHNHNDELLELLRNVLLSYPISKFYPFPLYENKELSGQLQSDDHLLGLLHRMIVSRNVENDVDPIPAWAVKLKNAVIKFLGLLHIITVSDKKDHTGNVENDVSVSDKKNHQGHRPRIPIPCAVKLKNAGIKFKELVPGVIHEIKYEKGTIHLPPITITDHTEVLFRNLVALELSKRFEINYVICYVTLMDELINCGEDVALLTRNRILTHHLGSDEEVAKLFNGLCTGVTLSQKDLGAFHQLRNAVHNDYNNKKKVQFAQFVNENFSPPWKALAMVGAVIGLLLTLAQTIFTILAYYNKK